MKNVIQSVFMAVALVALSGAAYAADSSATVTYRQAKRDVGQFPEFGYVAVTANASSTAVGFTFDLPVPEGKTSADILDFIGVASTVSGSTKPFLITRSGITVTVSGSSMTSGTITSGDIVKGVVIYK